MPNTFFDKFSEEDLLHFTSGSHFDYKKEILQDANIYDSGAYESSIVGFGPVFNELHHMVESPKIVLLELLQELIHIGVVKKTKNNTQVIKEWNTNQEFYIDGIDFQQLQELIYLNTHYKKLSMLEKEFLIDIAPVVGNHSEKLKLKLRGYSQKFLPNTLLNTLSYLYVKKRDKSKLLNLLGNIADTKEYSSIKKYVPRSISFDTENGEVKLNRKSLGVLKPQQLGYKFFEILYDNIGRYVSFEDIEKKTESIGKISDIKNKLPEGIKKLIESGKGVYRIK